MSSLRSEPEKKCRWTCHKCGGLGHRVRDFKTKHRELSRMWRSAARKVTEAKKILESMKRMYETLVEELTEILEREIVAIEGSTGAYPRHRVPGVQSRQCQ